MAFAIINISVCPAQNATDAAPTAPVLVRDKVSSTIHDKQEFQSPGNVKLSGWIGSRVDASRSNRLMIMDPDRLVGCFRKRTGGGSWFGEHIGKWLHASTMTWANTGDPALGAKLDRTVKDLCQCQLEDGYLGTYPEAERWTAWDVWSHKYNLLGLLTYIQHTGDTSALAACQRMGDLLCKSFGDGPGQRNIITSGTHKGLAPTSVLEPMVLLYRMTGEPRYLEFCQYLVRSWEQEEGPQLISRLLKEKRVDRVASTKAYEMLSCLNGALELYRTTGDPRLLEASLNAWKDITENRIYLTGASSYGEHFHGDFDLPNRHNVGETCVTVTWIQFNAQLLRLTGEARFADEIERTTLNQLMGAQHPDGRGWGYYVQMEGKKPYSTTLDGHCCLSSGPRGLALQPTFAVATDEDGAVVNLFEESVANLTLKDGTPLTLRTGTRYPSDGHVRLKIELREPKAFALKIRIPSWCKNWSVDPAAGWRRGEDGYLRSDKTWKSGDSVELNFELAPRLFVGDHLNEGKLALGYGPLVLAADDSLLVNSGVSLKTLALPSSDLSALGVVPEPAPEGWRTWPGAQVFRTHAANRHDGKPFDVLLASFADAGMSDARYRIWMPKVDHVPANSLFDETESRSRQGNRVESINDNSPVSFVTTYDGKLAGEDWFAVTLAAPATMRRIVFLHGKTFPDGGWFAGKPKVQIQREQNGVWETLGELADYPETTMTDSKGIQPGQAFTLNLHQPVEAVAVRVNGVPACGANPQQSFASCAELQAFND